MIPIVVENLISAKQFDRALGHFLPCTEVTNARYSVRRYISFQDAQLDYISGAAADEEEARCGQGQGVVTQSSHHSIVT